MAKKKVSTKKISRIIIITIILIVLSLLFIVFKNLFSNSASKRLEGMENYELSNNEKNAIKDDLSDIENVKNVNVYVTKDKTKIIKIIINLESDTDFKKVQEKCNSTLSNISEENLSFYDVEVFIESSDEESKVYPQIGYKHKTSKSFSW